MPAVSRPVIAAGRSGRVQPAPAAPPVPPGASDPPLGADRARFSRAALEKQVKRDLAVHLLEMPYPLAVAVNEVKGKERMLWVDGGRIGPARGWRSPFYRYRDHRHLYWAVALGAGCSVSHVASLAGSNLLAGRRALEGFDGLDLARHVVVNTALEDGLYWALFRKPVDESWMRRAFGASVGQGLGENSPLGLPFSYHVALGVALGGPLGRYRTWAAGRQDRTGEDGVVARMVTAEQAPGGALGYLDTAARASGVASLALAALPLATGKPLPDGLRAAGALAITGGAADGVATFEDGIRRRSLPGTIAGSLALASTLFQMATLAAHEGKNGRGLDNAILAPRVAGAAIALGLLSRVARWWERKTRR